MIKSIPHERAIVALKSVMDNVYWLQRERRLLVSTNLVPGQSVYGERLFSEAGKEYREWIPLRSKLAAAIYNRRRGFEIKAGHSILYLGASSGTTVSHVSDIVGEHGKVYAVEVSEEMGTRLILLSEKRKNIFPVIEDARRVDVLSQSVPRCDFIYQDIAQRDQVEIFIKNADAFLKKGCFGAVAIKAKSIDIFKSSKSVIDEAVSQLRRRFIVAETIDLNPYQRDHSLVMVKN